MRKSTVTAFLAFICLLTFTEILYGIDYHKLFDDSMELLGTDRKKAKNKLLEFIEHKNEITEDSLYYSACYHLSNLYFRSSIRDSSEHFLSETEDYTPQSSRIDNFSTEILLYKAIWLSRFETCETSLEYYDTFDKSRLTDTELTFKFYYNKAIVHKICRQLDQAIHHLEKLEQYELPDNRQAVVSLTLGQISKQQEDYKSAIRNLQHAIPLMDDESYNYGVAITTLASSYFLDEQYIEAKQVYEQFLSRSNVHDKHRLMSINNLWDIYAQENRLQDAENLLIEGRTIAQGLGNNEHILNLESNFGKLKMLQGKYAEAFVIFQNTEKAFRELNQPDEIHNIIRSLKSQIEALSKLTGNKNLSDAFAEYSVLKDSIQTVNLEESIQEYKTKYELHTKENEIQLQQATILKQKALLTGSGIGLLGFLVGLFYYRKHSRQLLKEQSEKLQELESKNQELISKVQNQKITKDTISAKDEVILDRNGTKIKLSDLVYVESSSRKNYIKLFTNKDGCLPEINSSLVKFQNLYLPKEIFVRTSKYRIVNLSYTTPTDDHLIIGDSANSVREDVGPIYADQFQKIYSQYKNT